MKNFSYSKSIFTLVLMLSVTFLFIQGCSFGHDHNDHEHGMSVADGDTLTGMHDKYSAVVTLDKTPTIGTDNEFKFKLMDSEGDIVTGATVTATTWMPAHNHGSSPDPLIHVMGADMDVIHIMKINFSMDGEWQVKVNVTKGDVTEMFTFTFHITA